MDFVAIYGHFVPNFMIIYMAITYNQSIYCGFNVLCICFMYVWAILRLQKRA